MTDTTSTPLWVQQWRNRYAEGDVIIVRYADDFVLGFQNRSDAQQFTNELGGRLQKFGLVVHPTKTRLIEFGRFAARNRKRRGEGKPETFDFLGFTHICGSKLTSRKFIVKRQTTAKRLRSKLADVKGALMRSRHAPIPAIGAWLRRVVRGYFN